MNRSVFVGRFPPHSLERLVPHKEDRPTLGEWGGEEGIGSVPFGWRNDQIIDSEEAVFEDLGNDSSTVKERFLEALLLA